MDGEQRAAAGLWSLPGIGGGGLRRIRARFGALAQILDVPFPDWSADVRLHPAAAEAFRTARERGLRTVADAADALFAACARAHIRWLFPGDPGWPARLSELRDAPPLLFVVGPGERPRCRPRVALVGTRTPEAGFWAVAAQLSDRLARSGVVVVSGAARGVDEACHRGALAGRGETWAFVGAGLDALDATQRQLCREIVLGGGSVFSELPPGVRPDLHTFPRRNRLISGASDAVVVLRAPARSGALITAADALAQQRPLFAMPAGFACASGKGSDRLLRDGQARLCLGPESLLPVLGLAPDALAPPLPPPRVDLAALSGPGRAALEGLQDGPRDVDGLAARTGLPPGTLLAGLTELELHGAARMLPGRRYLALVTPQVSGTPALC